MKKIQAKTSFHDVEQIMTLNSRTSWFSPVRLKGHRVEEAQPEPQPQPQQVDGYVG